MPHPDNAGWMSLLLRRRVTPPRRESVDDVVASRSFFDRSHLNLDLPEVAAIHEDVVVTDRPGRPLTAEIYVPLGTPPFPVLVYLHGGAWCAGSPRSARRVAMRLATEGIVVVSPDYGLAPEHPFPAAVEDAVLAARWAADNAHGYGGERGRIAIGGESAGANLAAAALAVLACGVPIAPDRKPTAGPDVEFSAALLVYGIFDFPLLMAEPGSNIGSVEIAFNAAYLGPRFSELHRHPTVSPVYTPRLEHFPPTYLTCGDEDSLLGQTLSMTQALADAGVPTQLSIVDGADHAFVYLDDALRGSAPELERMAAWLAGQTRAADSRP